MNDQETVPSQAHSETRPSAAQANFEKLAADERALDQADPTATTQAGVAQETVQRPATMPEVDTQHDLKPVNVEETVPNIVETGQATAIRNQTDHEPHVENVLGRATPITTAHPEGPGIVAGELANAEDRGQITETQKVNIFRSIANRVGWKI